MGNGNPSKAQYIFAGRFCNVWSGVVMQKVDLILLSLDFLRNPIQLLTADISSDVTTIGGKFPMNNTFDTPPNAQHDLLWMEIRFWCCCTCLTNTEPLTSAHIVDVQHPRLIALNPYEHQPSVGADGAIIHGVSKLHISMSCPILSDVFLRWYERT